jgi:hypothetical protein
MVVFNDLSEVAYLLVLILYRFGEFFQWTGAMWTDFRRYDKLERLLKQNGGKLSDKPDAKMIHLPARWFIGLLTFVMYILQVTAIFIFGQYVWGDTRGLYYEVPVVIFFDLMNIFCSKMWISVFHAAGRKRVWAGFLLLFFILSMVAVVIMLAYYNRWLEVALYLAGSIPWILGAVIIHGYYSYGDLSYSTYTVVTNTPVPEVVIGNRHSTSDDILLKNQ